MADNLHRGDTTTNQGSQLIFSTVTFRDLLPSLIDIIKGCFWFPLSR
jgi:hypothetical protein